MAAIVLGSFGVLVLILAAVGIYGVMSHVVAGRTREIGLRMALGAQLSDVQKLILKQGMLLAAVGSSCGLLIAFGGARMMKSLLYGVSSSDPITFTCVALLLVGIAFLACWIPARTASRVEPMIALRAEQFVNVRVRAARMPSADLSFPKDAPDGGGDTCLDEAGVYVRSGESCG